MCPIINFLVNAAVGAGRTGTRAASDNIRGNGPAPWGFVYLTERGIEGIAIGEYAKDSFFSLQ